MSVSASDVLDFWFLPVGVPGHGEARDAWFSKDAAFDAEIRMRFGAAIEAALAGGLHDWDATPRGALARILVLDQFTRNAFRDTAAAFSGDGLALEAAQALCDAGRDQDLSPMMRVFAYLPFEHAEDAAQQARSVSLFSALARGDASAVDYLDYAERHQAVIARFGRFPHRDALLGRASTAEELDYLAQPGAGF